MSGKGGEEKGWEGDGRVESGIVWRSEGREVGGSEGLKV